MDLMKFPNLEKYLIDSLQNVFSAKQALLAFDTENRKYRTILLFNSRFINIDTVLTFFDLYNLTLATRHHNIIRLHEVGRTYHGFTTYLYLILDGNFTNIKNLESEFINKNMTMEKSMPIICKTLSGLNHAHNYKIYHRNITTDRILCLNDNVKLSDFHLLFIPTNLSKDEQLTLLSYQPPEFFYDKSLCNHLSDIYSMGIVLFRCVNQYDNWLEVIKQLDDLERQVKTCNLINYIGYKSHVTNDIKAIINKACGHTLDNHYSSVLELKQDLINLFDIKN